MRFRRRHVVEDRRLEEYDFYPFDVTDDGHVTFSSERFNRAVQHFLAVDNRRAAGELIVIGQQNLVSDTLPSDELRAFKEFYDRYDGETVIVDNDAYLANYRRIVDHIGRSFPTTGIEILLHNLVNPAHALVAIHNAEVTGRSVGMGATNLVLDLKTRRQRGQDKINYELRIGARRFKCTTVPIFRPDFGLVGAICINIDVNFMHDVVKTSEAHLTAFFENLLRADLELDENILSPDEYRSALRGKRHFMDEAIRASGARQQERRLAVILFSDIVGYTTMMERDEAATLEIVRTNDAFHDLATSDHRGRVIKRMGDGVMLAFETASDAVAAAVQIQHEIARDGRYRSRIGVHLGEVTFDGNDVYGDGVNIASRVEGMVDAGEIGITQAVYDILRNQAGFSAEPLGERTLKGVGTPMRIYAVSSPPS